MDINEVFPSKFLKASDLQGQDVTATMESVTVEDVSGGGDEQDHKPIVYFVDKQKGLILNKTNANTIAGLYGPETDNWCGQAITLFPTQTEFAGKPVKCIRVRMDKPAGKPAPAPVKPHVEVTEDEIPF